MLYVVNSKPTVVPVNISTPQVENIIKKQNEFKLTLEKIVTDNSGPKKEGYEPIMFVLALPGLELEDFHQVEAMVGNYEYAAGELKHNTGSTEMLHTAATAITAEGMNTLLINLSNRLHFNLNVASVEEIVSALKEREVLVKPLPPISESPVPPTNPPETDYPPVACTMDAKQCSDGSYVGRTGPNCEFSACPAVTEKPVIKCAPGSKQAQMCMDLYAPVCGAVEVQCVTAPCNPIPQTFSNGCHACLEENVNAYTEGECSLEPQM
jgi:hypothetical protein